MPRSAHCGALRLFAVAQRPAGRFRLRAGSVAVIAPMRASKNFVFLFLLFLFY